MKLDPQDCILFSGAARGAEAEFGVVSRPEMGTRPVALDRDADKIAAYLGLRPREG